MDTTRIPALVAELRTRITPADEGSIWALYLDADHRPLLATAADDGLAQLDEQAIRTLAYVLGNVGADAVVVALPRSEGRPYDADRRLYRTLRALMVPDRTELLDLVVIGSACWWS